MACHKPHRTSNLRVDLLSRLRVVAILLALEATGFRTTGVLATEPTTSSTIETDRLGKIDDVVTAAIKRDELPGAVIAVVHRDEVVYHKAFGLRAKKPKEGPMTVDTIFDVASLTKPVATATSIMILLEQGKVNLSDPVARYLPEVAKNGKAKVTIEQMLLHTSGLSAGNPEAAYRDGKEKALASIYELGLEAPPGTRFRYSDISYIVLGELVQKIAKKPLDQFALEQIFIPLGMKDTSFLPDAAHKDRSAPCNLRDGQFIQGEVHDPRAYGLGGVAGHAGLFSTADDLSLYVRMILAGGELNKKRILSPLAVRLMTTPREVATEKTKGLRALGWDVDTAFSSNRGELFPRGESFGHTGFTGTSMWIDPGTQTAVIFLSNRLHPDGKGNVMRLRGQVATLVAAALRGPRLPTPGSSSQPLGKKE